MHLALCSGRSPSRRMEKCAQFLLRPTFFPWKSGHYFSEPLVLQYFQLCAVSARRFFGALDDEELFVVEGSVGWRGRRESRLPGDLPQLVSVTQCIVITVVTIHTVEHVSQTTTTNNKQQTTNNKQQTTNNKQQTTNNKQQTTNNKQQTTTTTTKRAHCFCASPVARWTLGGSPSQELPSDGEGDDCVLLGGMRSS